jgi:hypothetical protein
MLALATLFITPTLSSTLCTPPHLTCSRSPYPAYISSLIHCILCTFVMFVVDYLFSPHLNVWLTSQTHHVQSQTLVLPLPPQNSISLQSIQNTGSLFGSLRHLKCLEQSWTFNRHLTNICKCTNIYIAGRMCLCGRPCFLWLLNSH